MRVFSLSMFVAALALASPTHAINIGVRDDFQNGTVTEWYGGTSITPTASGQLGPSDTFITVATTGTSGAGSHLATHNSEVRWAGDYIAAGITGISVDMRNQGTTTLQMRVVLFGLGSRFTSTNMITLAPNSGWQHLTFPVSPTSLTRVLGGSTYAEAIGSVNQIMFRHDGSTPSSGGETINGVIGIDNVTAVPGPGVAGVMVLGGVFAWRRRRVRA